MGRTIGAAVVGYLTMFVLFATLSIATRHPAIPSRLAPLDPANLERGSDAGNLDATEKAQQPTWVQCTVPFVGAFGVIWGERNS